MANLKGLLCPSHRCKVGSQLLGVRQDDGTISILPQPLRVDQAFVDKVTGDEIPAEQRFRFTNKCIEGSCGQWNGKGCGVVERVVNLLDAVPALEELPTCPIRPKCRWYSERKSDACRICPYVLTEITEKEISDA